MNFIEPSRQQGKTNKIFETLKANAAKPDALEKTHQLVIFAWAALSVGKYPCLKWLHAIPNANSHRQVAEGVRGGVSDISLPYPKWIEIEQEGLYKTKHIKYCGLYIELKIEKRRMQKKGGCSQDQIDFIKYVDSVGYKAVVCYGWQEAVAAIEEYLK